MEQKKAGGLKTFSQYMVSLKNEFIKKLNQAADIEEAKSNAFYSENYEKLKEVLQNELELIDEIIEKIKILTSLRYQIRIRRIINRKGNEKFAATCLSLLRCARRLIRPVIKARAVVEAELACIENRNYSKLRAEYGYEQKLYAEKIQDPIRKYLPEILYLADNMKTKAKTQEMQQLAKQETTFGDSLTSSRLTGLKLAAMFFITVTLSIIFGCKSQEQPDIYDEIIVPGNITSYTQSITDQKQKELERSFEARRLRNLEEIKRAEKQQTIQKEIPIKELETSNEGIKFIKSHEGYRKTPYKCQADKWTIGYGHKINKKEMKKLKELTREQAENFFQKDLKIAENAVKGAIKVPLTQNQFDALVSWTFNLGVGKLYSSTMRKNINENKFNEALKEMLKWKYVKLKKEFTASAGLENRRKNEALLWEAGIYRF